MPGNFDGGWEARREAAQEAHDEEAFGHDDLPALVALLDHADPDVRAGAVWRIAELADDDPRRVEGFLDPIAECVSDPDAWVRRGATWAIQEVAEARPVVARSAMSALVEALADDDPLVVENAIVGIGSIAADYPETALRARDELRRVAEESDDSRLRRYAWDALERIADRLPEDDLVGGSVAVHSPAERRDHSPSANVLEADETRDEEGSEDDTTDETDSEESVGDRGRSVRYQRQATLGGSSPPSTIPEPSGVEVSLADVETEARLRSGPLLNVRRARVESEGASTPIELRVLGGEVRDREDAVELAREVRSAMSDWETIGDHETVSTVLDRGDGPPWLAAEVADGREFEVYAAASDFEEALYYASCLVRAVAHAHGNDVIHGGLSPRAVGFVEPIEDAWHVPKIAEWGIAPIVLDRFERMPVEPGYAAPELIAPGAFGDPDQATDVYGLGALLYALFAGRPPLEGEATEVAKRMRAAERGESLSADLPEPDPPSAHDETVPERADELVVRALSRDRMGRYETVADLRRDLRSLREEHTTW